MRAPASRQFIAQSVEPLGPNSTQARRVDEGDLCLRHGGTTLRVVTDSPIGRSPRVARCWDVSVGVPTVTVVLNPDADRLLESLDPEQREVATSFGTPVVVVAGAGTGKTRAITHRIAYGTATGAYQSPAVLAVTFTTRAAGELRTRLRSLRVANVQARTFHSAALRQAQYFWPRAYGASLPPVSDERIGMVAEAAHRLRLSPEPTTLRDLLAEVSWAKVCNVAPGEYAQLASASEREVAGMEPEWVGRVLGRYEQVKAERGVIDFDDILLCATALLGDHDDIAEEVRRAYRHLVVDEYQDVNPVQEGLLGLWRGNAEDLCVVGDPAQTIHSFAGATPDFLTGFTTRFPRARLVRLVRDYRSTPEIVSMANAVARSVGITGTVRLESQRDEGPRPRIRPFASEADEAVGVAQWVSELQAAGVPVREIAVLYRVHAQSPLFEAALARQGIPFVIRGGDGFFDRAEVRQALAGLQSMAESGNAESAPVGCRAVLTGLGWSETAPAGQGRLRERWESWSALLALAEDVGAERPDLGLAGLVEELSARARAEHPPQGDAVTLATLHAAKGLEWDAVALVGVQEGTLPLSLAAGPAQIAEEGRLLYVGVTRARRHLMISWSRSRRGGGPPRTASRFLEGLGAPGDHRPARRRPSAPVATALTETCRVCGRALGSGGERKLKRHRDCGPGYDEATYGRLVEWRRQEASNRALPPFCVFTDATLMAIAEQRPSDASELLAVSGVGRVKCEQYGPTVLALLAGEEESTSPLEA